MKNIELLRIEKNIIIIRDAIFIVFIYVILRGLITALIKENVDLNIELTSFEKMVGIFLWIFFIILTYFNSRLTKKLRHEFGKLFYFHFLMQSSLFSFITIVIIEIYLVIR